MESPESRRQLHASLHLHPELRAGSLVTVLLTAQAKDAMEVLQGDLYQGCLCCVCFS